MSSPKKLVLLGATGSIGDNTLKVIRKHPDKIELIGISAHQQVEKLFAIAEEFKVPLACLSKPPKEKVNPPSNTQLLADPNSLEELAALEEADIVAHGDSTLGYELLARGIKTIAITAKKSCYLDIFPQFSWPSKFDYKGPIWTNTDDENEILRLLNFIYSVNNEDWNNYILNVKDKIMQTDKDNKIFSNLIKKLIKNDKI